MKRFAAIFHRKRALRAWLFTNLILISAGMMYAQDGDPWTTAVDKLREAFTGPIAKGLCLVAVVVGGLVFAFGEGQGKKMLAGIIFGCGMALMAVNFLAWLGFM